MKRRLEQKFIKLEDSFSLFFYFLFFWYILFFTLFFFASKGENYSVWDKVECLPVDTEILKIEEQGND